MRGWYYQTNHLDGGISERLQRTQGHLTQLLYKSVLEWPGVDTAAVRMESKTEHE